MSDLKINKFLKKLFIILDNPENDPIICWDSEGQTLQIRDKENLQKDILPLYFAHKNFNSFVRQLHLYGFHKARSTDMILRFSNIHFLKDNRNLSVNIKRKRKTKKNQRMAQQPKSSDSEKQQFHRIFYEEEQYQNKDQYFIKDWSYLIENDSSDKLQLIMYD